MDTFPFTPIGDVKVSYTWGNKEVEFDSGEKQYVRKRIHAKKGYSFTIGGMIDYKKNFKVLLDFYNAHHGTKEKFLFDYDGKSEVVRFGSSIVPKCYRENGRIVTFSCSITLEVDKQQEDFGTPSIDDVIPVPLGETEETYDWHAGKVELGAMTDYYERRAKPMRKINAKFGGLKDTRDRIIRLFNAHCRTPLTYRNNGETLHVLLPDKLEITDHREAGSIVGFACSMELEVVE